MKRLWRKAFQFKNSCIQRGICTTGDERVQEFFTDKAECFISFIRKTYGIELGYDRDSLRWLDIIVDRIDKPENLEDTGFVVALIGGFIGEALRRIYGGGEWVYVQPEGGEEGVRNVYDHWFEVETEQGKRVKVNPLGKVHKRIVNGRSDSIFFLLTTVDGLLECMQVPVQKG